MPSTSQLWFVTKRAALVIGALALAHAVAAPRACGGCGVKAGKSQAAANPAENSALGGPDTKTGKATRKKTSTTGTGLLDGSGQNLLTDTPRSGAPAQSGVGGSMRSR